jgi:hypothetical protein
VSEKNVALLFAPELRNELYHAPFPGEENEGCILFMISFYSQPVPRTIPLDNSTI